MRPRRSARVVAAVVIPLAGAALLAWSFGGSPPPRLVLAHGLPPAGGPTGRREFVGGIEFIELSRGFYLAGSHFLCEQGDFVSRLAAVLGLQMGRAPRHGGECPRAYVEIRAPFLLARTEVTNLLFEQFDRSRRRTSFSADDQSPACGVAEEDSRAFCEWFSARCGRRVRLPTEVEWEYACRAGSPGEYPFGEDERLLGFEAWYEANSGGHAHEDAGKGANRWGFFDLMGNVSERTAGGAVRGGNYASLARDCRAAARPECEASRVGLRLATDSP